jgi:hypothetical protein
MTMTGALGRRHGAGVPGGRSTPGLRPWALAAALGASAACSNPTAPEEGLERLEASRRRFEAAVGADYRVTYRNVCFCVDTFREPVVLTVRQGTLVSVQRRSDGTPVPAARWDDYRTVERVFDAIEEALEDDADAVRVDYDAELGYPRDVWIDYDERLADEERGFQLEALEPQ